MFLLTQASPLIWFSLDGDKTSDNHTEIHLVLFPNFLEINSYQEKDDPYFPIFKKKRGKEIENLSLKNKNKKERE